MLDNSITRVQPIFNAKTLSQVILIPTEDNPMANESKPDAPKAISVNDAKAQSAYANFCRVTGSPEELIIDFGMNAQPIGSNDQPIDISQRIVLNFFTAKRLLGALHVSIQRHEQVFGVIETDIQKRVVVQTPEAT